MQYITSRNFLFTESEKEFTDGLWFNMWQIKVWAYQELVVGDLLYWYESPNKRIVWKSRVVDLDRFHYGSKDAARDRLLSKFGGFDPNQLYFTEAPEQGYCLAYKVKPLERVDLPRPADLQFPRRGWLRVDNRVARDWLSQSAPIDDATLDKIIPEGTVIERLRQLNDKMTEVSPERVRSIVLRTLRRDTKFVNALKDLCKFRCQFPGCGVRIPKRDGGFYIEVAHIQQVAKGGQSVLGNLLVLCPNHHKELDYGYLEVAEQTVGCVRGKLNGKEFEIQIPGLDGVG